MKSILLSLIITLSMLSLKATPSFTLANEAYQNKDFVLAIKLYNESLESSQSFAQHFNLANAYYENKEFGKAILHYEKALILQPQNVESLNNRQKAYDALNMEVSKASSMYYFINILSAHSWTWICLIVFIFAILLIYIRVYCGIRNSLIKLFSWICLLLSILLIIINIFYVLQTRIGIVVRSEVPLKISPTQSSPTIVLLDEGSRGTVIYSKNEVENFKLIRINNQEGWVSTEDFRMIWE